MSDFALGENKTQLSTCIGELHSQLSALTGDFSSLILKDSPMTTIEIAAADPKQNQPGQTQQPGQQNQQPGDNQNQQGGAPSKDTPQQK